MPVIHPTAIVDRRADLAEDVHVGPYSIIEGRVIVGAGCRIESHSVLRGHSVIGRNCKIGPAAYVGLDPQHLKFDGRETSLIIGDNVVIRENVSIHRAFTPGEEHATRVGNGCFLMATSHVGHDCRVGNDVILANGVMLGGHVTVGDRAFVGGGTAIHQFCRMGRLAIISGNEAISRDVPPFAAVKYGGMKGYNAIGCRRAGMSAHTVHALRRAFLAMHSHRMMPAVLLAIRSDECSKTAEVQELLQFIVTSKRGIQPSINSLSAMMNDSDD